MRDAIIKGTGNSRYLKSVSNFIQLYPTYQDFAQALVDGTFPIDLNGINTNGFSDTGTALSKANLLTDSTAAIIGLGDEATPNDMLAALAGRITYGTENLTAGESGLADGVVYLVYK